MSSGHGRRTKGGHEEEHENHERWAVSYADMMTVLCALFIVLYAMSTVDQVKYEALAQSLSEGFNSGKPDVLSGTDGVLEGVTAGTPNASAVGGPAEPASTVDPAALPPTDLQLAQQEVARLREVQAQIEANLAAAGMGHQVRYLIDERGLVIGLVANDVFFDSGSAALQPAANTVLDAAAPVLLAIPDRISVEGHANIIPTSGRYATNWELSADRATQVLRRLVETDGLPGGRISATGYGDTQPLEPGSSPEALATNRRVDLVINSSMPDHVRGLIPSVVDGTATAAAAAPAAAEHTTETAAAAAPTDDHDDDEGH
ncbi:flagellar motor protein MotB [uncultured Cellulomonas sp.]|uniref:OmpA/MotB family protein n=1 Tax=uncultured Cellulomonas sp. TaxID=189682 RepID=UPI00261EA049|nr:flagellar motor protein MotB [uncultured Cellulomonas sp.]